MCEAEKTRVLTEATTSTALVIMMASQAFVEWWGEVYVWSRLRIGDGWYISLIYSVSLILFDTGLMDETMTAITNKSLVT